jgi:hypothetical protein
VWNAEMGNGLPFAQRAIFPASNKILIYFKLNFRLYEYISQLLEVTCCCPIAISWFVSLIKSKISAIHSQHQQNEKSYTQEESRMWKRK